jgi:hypothetical protein
MQVSQWPRLQHHSGRQRLVSAPPWGHAPPCAAKPSAALVAFGSAPQQDRSQQAAAQLQQPRRQRKASPPQDSAASTSGRVFTDAALLQWERNGFVTTRGLLPLQLMAQLKAACEVEVAAQRLSSLRHRARVLAGEGRGAELLRTEAECWQVLREKSAEPVGFLQVFNSHRRNASIARVVLGPELAAAAAQLLGARRVRVYQVSSYLASIRRGRALLLLVGDQGRRAAQPSWAPASDPQDSMFYKEPGMSVTNWHSDLRMTPLDGAGRQGLRLRVHPRPVIKSICYCYPGPQATRL